MMVFEAVGGNISDNRSLSLVQQDIFYDQLHYINTPKYNIGGYVSLGSIDENKLMQAHAAVVSNNRMFRMQLINRADGVFACFDSTVNTTLPLLDLSTESNPELSAHQWISDAFSHAFDLFEKSLFKVTLLKLSNSQYFYVAIAHHLLVDGWGIAGWARLLGNYYSGLNPDIESESDFTTYFTQDLDYLKSSRYQNDRIFWNDYLAGQPVRLFSPLRANTEDSSNKCSRRLSFDISIELYKKLISSSDVLGKNEHSVFFALAAFYFSRVLQRDEITIGVPAHNRRGAIHKKMIGLYTSVSPVRIVLQDDWSFIQLVEAVKTEQAKIYRHQKYPIGHMVRDLGPAARMGLFDIGVNYLKLENKFSYGDFFAEIRYVENNYQTTPFNLTIWNNGENQPVQLQVDFCLNYFNASDIKAIGARFDYLLEQIAVSPNVRLADLDIITPTELSVVWQGTKLSTVPIFIPFINEFEQQASRQPDRVALTYAQQSFTYRDLNQLASILAVNLSERGVSAGHIVGILLGRKPEMLIAILALHKLGAAYLPLDSSYPAQRLHFMLEDSGCKLLLTTTDLTIFSAGLNLDVMTLDAAAKIQENVDNKSIEKLPLLSASAEPTQLAYVIYTSGSTGKPKGVMISQQALSNFLQSMTREPGFGRDDCLLAITPFSFDISILELLMPLMSGGTVRLFHTALAQDVAGFIRDLENHPITMLQMTPSGWKILLSAGWQGDQKLVALTGGEALPAHLAETIAAKVGHLWNMYGPTETTIWSSCTKVHLPMKINSIGKPIDNTQMLVLDSKNRILPVGIFGMLHIGGSGLAEGYFCRPELTAEKFITLFGERWYQTGDIARLLPSGEFEFQGRADHQVKLNGYRIELGEIEACLSRYPGVTNIAVLIKTLNGGRQVLCAYYQSTTIINEGKIKNVLATELPAFMIPSVFIKVSAFPLTPAGKTDLRALPEPDISSSNEQENTHRQYDELTTTLLTLVKSHLQITQLEPTDNFFDVGATSIDVTDISVKINRELHLNISVIDLFAHPSISGLVKFLQGHIQAQQPAQMIKRQEAAQRGKSRLNNRLNARKLLDEA